MRLKSPVVVPLLIMLLLLGSGCSSNPYSVPDVVDGEPDYGGQSPAPAPQPTPPPSEPADPGPYAQLLQRAADARARKDYDTALALLERAQRIDPDSAEIYLNMAMTHKASGDMVQARATAERGLLYCTGQSQCDALRAYLR